MARNRDPIQATQVKKYLLSGHSGVPWELKGRILKSFPEALRLSWEPSAMETALLLSPRATRGNSLLLGNLFVASPSALHLPEPPRSSLTAVSMLRPVPAGPAISGRP